MVGVLGRYGKHGRTTLYTEDVKTFYVDEDIPRAYERRELPVNGVLPMICLLKAYNRF